MKKTVLLCLTFVFCNTFYGQETTKKTKARTETVKKKTTSNNAAATNSKKTGTTQSVKTNVKTEYKTSAKSGVVKKDATTTKKIKETNEKAPKVADKVTGKYNGKKVYTGPRGGKYYINSKGNKTYIQD